MQMLRVAGGDHLGVDEPLAGAERGEGEGVAAGACVAERLGHLPLALALAAAYMRACDVTCARSPAATSV